MVLSPLPQHALEVVFMLRSYLSTVVSDGTDLGTEPAVCLAYSGSWSSRPGTDKDHIIVVADVTDAEHAAIVAVDGVEVLP